MLDCVENGQEAVTDRVTVCVRERDSERVRESVCVRERVCEREKDALKTERKQFS